ncbi:MAG: dephospho-CoA kinase [Bacteroidales bacterium]|jgi:dephospho-CoA kinase|nr:dephospho-CoA kinase [Bacteroidales bacterium]
MLKIALTGGIGAGKSYVASLFEIMSVPVFYADDEAKKLYDRGDVKALVKRHFGEAVYQNDVLDKTKLTQAVFSNPDNLTLINNIIHPRLMEDFDCWAVAQRSPVVILESAIIFEANLARFFDLVLTVHAPLEKRLHRLKNRNPDWTNADINQRVASQLDQECKVKMADLVVWNGEEGGREIVYLMR